MKRQWKREPKEQQADQCVEYFRTYPVFDRLLRGFREKYISYGSFSGNVVLRNLKAEDIEALEGFFSKSYHGKKSASISAANFEKSLKNSRFDGVEPRELLEKYFGEEMTGRRQLRKDEEERRRQSLSVVMEEYKGTPAEYWLNEFMTPEKSPELAKFTMQELRLVAQIINAFPYREGRQEYLAVFAALLTGNPHAFDDREKSSNLLKMLIRWDVQRRGIIIRDEDIFPAIQKQKLYLKVGILRDDISNYVMLFGVSVRKKDGKVHEGMEGFLREGDMVQVPLGVISSWSKLKCPDNEIYIMENPSIYAMFCQKWRGQRACMCMNGQPRLSSILILDMLAEAGIKVYYSGDFDPEGLLIAQKLGQYYQGDFAYWHMTKEAYEMTCPCETISERRLKMLDNITDPKLQKVSEAIKNKGMAGYQENIWQLLLGCG